MLVEFKVFAMNGEGLLGMSVRLGTVLAFNMPLTAPILQRYLAY